MNYDVIQPNKELRAYARQQLRGVWRQMAFAFFICFLIYLPYNIFSSLNSINKTKAKLIEVDIYNTSFPFMDFIYEVTPAIPFLSEITQILAIVVFATEGAFLLGFCGYFLKRIRGQEISIRNIFDGFKRFFQSLLLFFFTVIFTALWSLLLIIPGIIKIHSYSMAFFIMYDNPEIKALEALKKSKTMMNGYKGKLFLLNLSFIGWVLPLAVIFLIGLTSSSIYLYFLLLEAFIGCWLYPYIGLSIANFYENLKIYSKGTSEQETKSNVAGLGNENILY